MAETSEKGPVATGTVILSTQPAPRPGAASAEPSEFEVRQPRPWPRWLRALAIVLWCGFLGAGLQLFALLAGWDLLGGLSTGPSWDVLGLAFALSWLIGAVIALMALALAPPGFDLGVDEDDLP